MFHYKVIEKASEVLQRILKDLNSGITGDFLA